MASTYWVKLYIEILDDPKIGLMPDWLFRRFIQLLLAAGENRDDGILQPVTQLAWRLRVTEKDLGEALRALREIGVVHEAEPGIWVVTNFIKRQDALTPAEKQKNYRERKHKEEYYGSDDDSVTDSVTNGNTDTDTESYTESETDKRSKDVAGKPARAPAKSPPARDDKLKITKHPEMRAVARELAIVYGAKKRKPPDYFKSPQQLEGYMHAYSALGRDWDAMVKKAISRECISLEKLLAFLEGCVKNKSGNSPNGSKPPATAAPDPHDYDAWNEGRDDPPDEGDIPLDPPVISEGDRVWRNYLSFNTMSLETKRRLEGMTAEVCGDCLVVHAGKQAEWCRAHVGASMIRFLDGVQGIAGVEFQPS